MIFFSLSSLVACNVQAVSAGTTYENTALLLSVLSALDYRVLEPPVGPFRTPSLFLYFGSWSFLVRRSPFLPNTPPQPVASPLIRPCFCRWFLSCCLLPVCVDVHRFALWHAVMWRVTKASVAAQINIPPQVCTCSKRKYAGAFRAAACYLSYIAVVTF